MNYNKTIFGYLLIASLMVPTLQNLQAQLPGGIEGGYNYYPTRGYRNPNPVYQVQPGYYTHYPTDRTVLYQQAVVPSTEIQGMQAEVEDAMNMIDNVDILIVSNVKKQRKFIEHQNIARALGKRFGMEYRKYVDMLQRNDPGLRNQEIRLKKIYKNFEAHYGELQKNLNVNTK